MPLKQSTKNPSIMIWVPESKNKDGVRKYVMGQLAEREKRDQADRLVYVSRMADRQAGLSTVWHKSPPP